MRWIPILYPDLESLSKGTAEEIARRINTSSRNFSIGLSGGNTPLTLYRLLATEYRDRIPWERVHLFFGDERYVPHDAPESNYRMVREAMLEWLPIPEGNVHPIPTDFPDPDDAARTYEKTLRDYFGSGPPSIDLSILGMGDDGHTASLFPGDSALEESERLVTVGHAPVEPRTRITLTFPALNAARTTFFLIAGESKRRVMRESVENQEHARERYPAAMVEGDVVLLVDRAAWG